MKANNNSGFSVVELLLIVAIIAVLGFVGWRVWDAQNKPVANQTNQSQSSDAPLINKASDLDEASKAVDNVDLSDSDQDLTNMQKDLDSL